MQSLQPSSPGPVGKSNATKTKKIIRNLNLAQIVKSTDGAPQPPRKLGKSGADLWRRVHSAYAIEDEGGIELLCLACEALDRAESLRAAIEIDGEILKTKTGLKDHPGLKHELASRAFVSKCISRLGLDVEAIKPVGRPGNRYGP